ncbi:MAG: HNH endonuclease signature motif containing protein [Coriobacteriia bacterium]|nr:HNH endonuclease signature motif containing protein [Coriobacteriia bacterium]
MARINWTKRETMMAFALYRVLPSNCINDRNPEIQRLASALGRTPSAVKMKIENLKRCDPVRVAAGQRGLPNGSKLEPLIWEEYLEQGDEYLGQAISLLTEVLNGEAVTPEVRYALIELPPEGKERMTQRVERANQQYFRNSLLQNYNGKCCVTGLAVPELLVASHIKPWAVADPKTERLSPSNGLLLVCSQIKVDTWGC